MTKYLSAAETAKIVRKMLKENFKGTKFSVRSETYSMGSAVNVKWTDGPTEQEVNDVIGYLRGSGFDGMIDLKYSVYHWMLPNGEIVLAETDGSVGSGGVDPSFAMEPPMEGAVKVCLADHIGLHRGYSKDLMNKIVSYINGKFGSSVNVVEFGDHCTMNVLVEGERNSRTFWRIQQNAKLVHGLLAINGEHMTSNELSEIL